MKTTLLCKTTLLAMALSVLPGAGIIQANAASVPAKEISLQGKKPARFNHTTHTVLGITCGACHHDQQHKPLTAEAMDAVTDPATLRCLSCHNDQQPKQELRQAKDIFHARCKTCHQAGYEGKNGPVTCSGCHLKSDKKAAEGC